MQKFQGQDLKPGQFIPDIELRYVLNYKSDKLKLSDFRDKLIILDFWSPTCLSCIEAFPKLDSLQKYFGNKVQIILVGQESMGAVNAFFEKRKRIKIPEIPMVTSDTLLNNLFPHTGVPHHIWIDTMGKFTYTTYSYYLTKTNIEKFLNGENLKLTNLKKTTHLESLFDKNIAITPAYYSYIGYCINEGSVHLNGPKYSDGVITSDICLSAMQLYQMAFNESRDIYCYKYSRPGRTILKVSDPFKYKRPEDPDRLQFWISNHSYYYQLVLPKERETEKYKVMKEDLNRFFNLKAKVVKQMVKCYVLERSGKIDKLKTKGGIPKHTFLKTDERYPPIDSIGELRNMPFNVFSNKLQSIIEIDLNYPFFDNTNYKGKIDVVMRKETVDFPSIPSLNRELKKYNLRLIEKEMQIDVLVLEDNVSNKKEGFRNPV